jgi:aspartyl-tRNA(Asn)/glutamyl-tRNA(Gln) amidotransferase subunit B
MAPELTPTIGLEIHVRLDTGRKLFCHCTYDFGAPANARTCPVCLGLPGSLPVLDQAAVDLALRVGVALGCRINPVSEFDRKNYFYPDLPRNYQITQFERPLLTGGRLDVPGQEATVRLRRIHLEEDAGRSLEAASVSGQPPRLGVDANRAGAPLLEIVTEPDLTSGAQARRWLGNLLQTLEYLEVCDGKMAEGSLRCDANVGFEVAGGRAGRAGPLTEIKNLNSFRFIAQALDHEIQRLGALISGGGQPEVQTRSWDAAAGCTRFMRRKEATLDYRYFPEPDLPPLVVAPARIQAARLAQPELPQARRDRFIRQYGLAPENASTLCRTRQLADYFESCTAAVDGQLGGDLAGAAAASASWVLGPVLRECGGREQGTMGTVAPPDRLAEVVALLARGSVSQGVARDLFQRLVDEGPAFSPGETVIKEGLQRIQDEAVIRQWCGQVVAQFPEQAAAVTAGKAAVLEFLVGQVMKLGKGRADPETVRRELGKVLEMGT